MEKQLSSQQSLDLIARTISDTRTRLERNSGRPFLIWGYTVVAISLLNYCLTVSSGLLGYGSWTWFLIPVIGFILTRIFPMRKCNEPRTEIDRIISKIWLVLALGIAPAFVIAIFSRSDIYGIITLLMASGIAITGVIVRSRIYTLFGFIGMGLSTLFSIFGWWLKNFVDLEALVDADRWIVCIPMLAYALVFIVMMVIPGHIMNYKNRKQCSQS